MSVKRALLLSAVVCIVLYFVSLHNRNHDALDHEHESAPPPLLTGAKHNSPSLLKRRKQTLSRTGKQKSSVGGKGGGGRREISWAPAAAGDAAGYSDPNCPFAPLVGESQCIVARCPEEGSYVRRWLEKKKNLLEGDERRKKRFALVNVGSNKGYAVSSILGDALGVPGISSRSLGRSALDRLRHLFPGETDEMKLVELAAGNCCDAFSETDGGPRKLYRDFSSIHVYAFDPVAANIVFLSDFMRVASNLVEFHGVHAAVSDTNSTSPVMFPAVRFGEERASLLNHAAGAAVTPVAQISLDEYLPRRSTIDVLTVDAEGADALVLRGGWSFIRRGKVRLIVFESSANENAVSSSSASKISSFRTLVRDLDGAGYSCFFPLEPMEPGQDCRRVLPISGMCWREEFSIGASSWSNVVCVNRREVELVQLFDAELKYEAREFWPKCKAEEIRSRGWKL